MHENYNFLTHFCTELLRLASHSFMLNGRHSDFKLIHFIRLFYLVNLFNNKYALQV